MRTKTAFAALAAAMLTVAGCATQPAQYSSETLTYGELTRAEQEVIKVNRDAWMRGYDVYWVNPPTKRYHDRKQKEERRAARRGDTDNGNG